MLVNQWIMFSVKSSGPPISSDLSASSSGSYSGGMLRWGSRKDERPWKIPDWGMVKVYCDMLKSEFSGGSSACDLEGVEGRDSGCGVVVVVGAGLWVCHARRSGDGFWCCIGTRK